MDYETLSRRYSSRAEARASDSLTSNPTKGEMEWWVSTNAHKTLIFDQAHLKTEWAIPVPRRAHIRIEGIVENIAGTGDVHDAIFLAGNCHPKQMQHVVGTTCDVDGESHIVRLASAQAFVQGEMVWIRTAEYYFQGSGGSNGYRIPIFAMLNRVVWVDPDRNRVGLDLSVPVDIVGGSIAAINGAVDSCGDPITRHGLPLFAVDDVLIEGPGQLISPYGSLEGGGAFQSHIRLSQPVAEFGVSIAAASGCEFKLDRPQCRKGIDLAGNSYGSRVIIADAIYDDFGAPEATPFLTIGERGYDCGAWVDGLEAAGYTQSKGIIAITTSTKSTVEVIRGNAPDADGDLMRIYQPARNATGNAQPMTSECSAAFSGFAGVGSVDLFGSIRAPAGHDYIENCTLAGEISGTCTIPQKAVWIEKGSGHHIDMRVDDPAAQVKISSGASATGGW